MSFGVPRGLSYRYVNNIGFEFGGEFARGSLRRSPPTAPLGRWSYGNKLTAFEIAADGSLSNRRL
jgi:hypothetical protein